MHTFVSASYLAGIELGENTARVKNNSSFSKIWPRKILPHPQSTFCDFDARYSLYEYDSKYTSSDEMISFIVLLHMYYCISQPEL